MFALLLTGFLISCGSHQNIPDVSGIRINIRTERYERDFFRIDTNDIAGSLQALLRAYPRFTPDFIENIVGLDLDSLLEPRNAQDAALRLFLRDYRPLKDSCDVLYRSFDQEAGEIRQGLQFVKYYFPAYRLPAAIITFIGPVNASFQTSFGTQGDVITREGLGVGLQLHMGKDFSLYRSEEGQEQYPSYLSRNFDSKHIAVNCMRNIIDDLYPDSSAGKPLVDLMVEKGRRMYLLTHLLPYTPEYLCFNYTEEQLKGCYRSEASIWSFFLNNELLHNTEESTIENYIGEGPTTQGLGEASPGNIGTFVGLQIVRKYLENHPRTSLPQLMKLDDGTIFNEARYKPRT